MTTEPLSGAVRASEEPHREDSPSAEAWGDCGSTRERAVMKKFLVIALIEGADIDGGTPEVVQDDLKDLIEHDFADSAKVVVEEVDTAILHDMFGKIDLADKFFL